MKQNTFVQVAVNVPQVTGVFDYHVPPELEGEIKPGCLVVVPFGRQTVQGVIRGMVDEPQVMETKAVLALLDPEPAINTAQFALADWMAKETHSTSAVCLSLMLPPGLSQQADVLYRLNPGPPEIDKPLSAAQNKLVALLKRRGDLRGRQIDTNMRHIDWRPAARALVSKGIFLSEHVLPAPSVRPKVVRTVRLAPDVEDIPPASELGRDEAGKRRVKIMHYLAKENKDCAVQLVYAYSNGNLQDLKKLAEKGLVDLGEGETWRDPLAKAEVESPQIHTLTADQEKVWDEVAQGLDAAAKGQTVKPYLLHGVTGSGKTEIYLKAVTETLNKGRQAIIMVPEIALTPQTIRRFMARFTDKVGVIHSRLSPGERYDTWRRARSGELQVIVGPRSALFAPLPNIGLIVLDECHDDSYYQGEGRPYYHAVKSAVAYGDLLKAVVIMGSATPGVDLMYTAQRNDWNMLKLPARILAHRQTVEEQFGALGRDMPEFSAEGDAARLPLPPVTVIDMRRELKAGNRSIFSRTLSHALSGVLDAGQQAILFLNRRGTSTYIFCRDCGHSLRCPRCDLPLTYHRGQDVLLCHTCSYQRKLPKKCPECGSDKIKQFGTGTEKVEGMVRQMFPDTTTLRWDAETARGKGAHDIILSHFVNRRADILIGTQMLAKGLDLPLVTLVGVILADVGLNFPDFRAGERTFQLLTQVAGRAGRSPLGGQVILQTFQPEHYAIQHAAEHDYDSFLERELKERQRLLYPPYTRLIRLEYRHQKNEAAEQEAKTLTGWLEQRIEEGGHKATRIIGPAPCYFARLGGYYRWQIILRGPDPLRILGEKKLDDWRVEVDPPNVL